MVEYRFRLVSASGPAREFTIDVGPDDTIGDVKRKIRATHGISDVLDLHLIFPGSEGNGQSRGTPSDTSS